jgi:tripartite-type tricarboxylate transporter receptor subunit TctC
MWQSESFKNELPQRRQFLHPGAGTDTLSAMSRLAQTYPSRPVRIIVTSATGSTMDVHGRLHGRWLSERLDPPFINRAIDLISRHAGGRVAYSCYNFCDWRHAHGHVLGS